MSVCVEVRTDSLRDETVPLTIFLAFPSEIFLTFAVDDREGLVLETIAIIYFDALGCDPMASRKIRPNHLNSWVR